MGRPRPLYYNSGPYNEGEPSQPPPAVGPLQGDSHAPPLADFNIPLSQGSPTPSTHSRNSVGSGRSSVIMDSPPQDNPSPCRLTITRREEGWAVKQPRNSLPPKLPDTVPSLKLSRRRAIDGRASIKCPATDVPHRGQRSRYMVRRTPKRRLAFCSPPSPETCKMRIASSCVGVCWLAACHAAQMPFILTDNVPHLLSDGLLITRASDIHVRTGI